MDLNRISRRMSFLLRHKKGFFDEHGWAPVSEVVREIRKNYPEFTEKILDEIVRTDKKGRYSYDGQKVNIRANQGHSVPVDVGLVRREPPKCLYHGTAKRFLPSILQEGLDGRSRLYVHLSTDVETARIVGRRHGAPAVLKIETEQMHKDGYEFFLSENNVWLTKEVPVKYLRETEE